MAKLIGTAGHVDHGKTTLIKALTGIDADRFPEEKDRGLTIDIGFAYIDLPEHGRVSIVDVPGHEKFLTNMLVGALGIDVALLCVASDESVMPQTREHLQILELLPVDQLVVAMTRKDLVDEEILEFAMEEVRETIAATRFGTATLVPVSAITGEGLETLKTELAAALSKESKPIEGLWYLPIDRAFSVKGHGCVVTGTLAQGRVRVGDRGYLEPGHTEVRVRSIHHHGASLEETEKGRRTAINLAGIKLEDLRRGQAIGAPGALFETVCFDGRVKWVGAAKHAMRVRVSIGSDEAFGKLFLNNHDPDLVQLRLERPVAAALGQPFVLRRYSPPDVLCGGRISVPLAKPRRKGEEVQALEAGGEDAGILQVLAGKEQGVSTEEICRQLGRTPQALGDVFERLQGEGRIVGFAGLWFEPEAFERGVGQWLAALETLHEKHPMQGYQARERALAEAGLTWSGKPLDRIVARLAAEERVVASGPNVRLPDFKVRLNDKQQAFLARIVQALEAKGVNTPSPEELAQELGVPIHGVQEMLKIGSQVGEILTVPPGLIYTARQIETVKQALKKSFGEAPFAAAEAREVLSTSRKYMIPLLEYLDSARFTVRIGDKRKIL